MIYLGAAALFFLGSTIWLLADRRGLVRDNEIMRQEVDGFVLADLRPRLWQLAAFNRPFSLHYGLPDYVLTEEGDGRPRWSASGTIEDMGNRLAVTAIEERDPKDALGALLDKMTDHATTGRRRW